MSSFNFESWHDGLIRVGLEGEILAVNHSAQSILGWPESKVLGRCAHDILCKHSIYTSHQEEDCPLCTQGVEQVQPVEAYWTHQNSENIPVSYRRVNDGTGHMLIIFNSCARQGFQVDELRKLATFTEINPAPLLELNSEGLILFSNPAMTELMLDYGFNDEGSPSILPKDLAGLVARALVQGGLENVESSAISEDGESVVCHFLWHFHISEGSQGKTILLSGLDVTGKKLMEAQRAQYERELELEKERTRKEYLAMMVHELRSPLNAVVGYANVLKLKLKDKITDAQLMLFDKIIEGGNQLAEQISDTLESSKVEAAQMSAKVSRFDGVPVIKKVCSELDSTAIQKGLKLLLNIEGETYLNADSQHFRQIAINLISNAVKYTAEGTVTVNLGMTEDAMLGLCVSLSVNDTGCGIPAAQKDSIFKLYERQEGHVASDIEGDGYGLAIVGEMVELNSGRLLLDSRVGTGSTFTVMFPA